MADVAVKGQMEKLLAEFSRNAEAISARVYLARGCPEAADILAGLIKALEIKKIVATSSSLVRELNLDSISGGAQVCREKLRLQAADADMGVSEADFAIAETGTLVHDSTDINTRLVSTLPPVHVALVSGDAIMATLRDAIGLYSRNTGSLPRYLSFISGPSRTADIERVLTIGVHGPAQLHIIFVGRPGGGSQ